MKIDLPIKIQNYPSQGHKVPQFDVLFPLNEYYFEPSQTCHCHGPPTSKWWPYLSTICKWFQITVGRKIKKNKLVKSTKSISWNNFLTKFHFLQFQKRPKINFWTGKSLKLPKMQLHITIFFLFIWFQEFFYWIF